MAGETTNTYKSDLATSKGVVAVGVMLKHSNPICGNKL